MMLRQIVQILLVLATCLVMPAFAGDLARQIEITAPYVRAVPPGQPNSAAFMTLTNSGDVDGALVAAASPAAEVVELHTHAMVDGMMRMRRIERIALPAGETVKLAPGGLHVMLIGLVAPLVIDETVEIRLSFDDGSERLVSAPVRPIQPMHAPHQAH
jgi:copper(I)-binding protein